MTHCFVSLVSTPANAEYDFDDDWSDEEPTPAAELAATKASVKKLQSLLTSLTTEPEAGPSKPRDDDTHYFGSYEENGENVI